MTENSQNVPAVNPPPEQSPNDNAGRKKRLAIAFVVAAVSDLLSAWLEFIPPMQWALDLVTGLLLFFILGRQWAILPGLIAEAIPGIAVFPVWILVVAAIAAWGTIKPGGPARS